MRTDRQTDGHTTGHLKINANLLQFHGGGDDGTLVEILRLSTTSLGRERFLSHSLSSIIGIAGGLLARAAQGTAETLGGGGDRKK